jgi:hypothetical protein
MKDITISPFEVVGKFFNASEMQRLSMDDKIDLFFHDYSLMPLFVEVRRLEVSSAVDCFPLVSSEAHPCRKCILPRVLPLATMWFSTSKLLHVLPKPSATAILFARGQHVLSTSIDTCLLVSGQPFHHTTADVQSASSPSSHVLRPVRQRALIGILCAYPCPATPCRPGEMLKGGLSGRAEFPRVSFGQENNLAATVLTGTQLSGWG